MEYSKNGLDFLLWPRTWHKRFDKTILPLIPLCIFVGVYDVLNAEPSILNDHLLTANSGFALKAVLALLISAAIGFVDVFCFAWPIADLCRYIGKRTEKFVAPGFHFMLMKSYAFSHLMFVPFLVLTMPIGNQTGLVSPDSALYSIIAILVVVWQLAILLRTVSVKTKLESSGRLLVGAAIYIWSSFEAIALGYLLRLSYDLFGVMDKIS